ncbi:hypothetical protein GPALN_003509 [Globodera pallida]|nr:hypothetical protein GPALN_003509 [Globodera pallida]
MQQNINRASIKAFFKAFSQSYEFSTRAREPSIKFLGTRHPQPKFDASATSSSAAASHDSKASTTSAKPVMVFSELPAKFRRKPISEEEIQIINSGGFRS